MPQVDSPNGNNLYIGNAAIYVAETTGANAGGERFIGNCTQFAVSASGTAIEKRSRVSASRGVYAKFTPTKDVKLAITCDETTVDNLKLHLLAGETSNVQGSGTVEDDPQPVDDWVFGLWYALPHRGLSSFVLTYDGGTTATLDTDYELDAATGRFRILEAGGITEGEPLLISYAYAASTRTRLSVATATDLVRSIRFIGHSTRGASYDGFFPKVYVNPNGEAAFIQEGDEPGTLVFECTVADDSENYPTAPFGWVEKK